VRGHWASVRIVVPVRLPVQMPAIGKDAAVEAPAKSIDRAEHSAMLDAVTARGYRCEP